MIERAFFQRELEISLGRSPLVRCKKHSLPIIDSGRNKEWLELGEFSNFLFCDIRK